MAEEKCTKWFNLSEKIAVFNAFEASKFVAKKKLGGRIDFFYVPLGKEPFARLDRPHKGFNFCHLNINPKYTNHPDPHIKVPETAYKSVPLTLKAAEVVGEMAFYLAVAYDTYKLGSALSKDIQNNTSHETVDAASTIGGTWVGGYAGGSLGAKVGTLASPGFGTFIGGLVGAMYGAYYGRTGAEYAKDKIKEADCGQLVSSTKDQLKQTSEQAHNIAKKYYFTNSWKELFGF